MGKSAEFAIDKAREVYEKHKDDHDTTEDDAYIVVSYRDVDKEAERVVDVVMTAFKEEDAGTLQDLFSEYISEQYDIAAQIKEAFAFIDGEIVSTGDVLAGYSGGSTSALHGEVESLYDGTICEVTTDIGKEYTIQFRGVYNFRNHDNQIGVTNIYIIDNAKYDVYLGENEGAEIGIGDWQ